MSTSKKKIQIPAKHIGAGKSPAYRRHRKILKDSILGVTRPSIRRIARRAGVYRISEPIYNSLREVIRTKLYELLRAIVTVVEYRDRKTVTVADVVWVLKRQGRAIYGFGEGERV
ncbi:uncharacterized protein K452DRAFT_296601 [Aplosporella prunicola CBS 121167]|uniref:Histone H4 n=1 Tax=Aplosporella prunicola CBS 121167 TaxID=1176127 RepID=A0A6A6BHG9_9PEZI|nr:uncharacterized protein K452DRAFT_296601 [Aplosporella prunicola CBS 121167]KAF2143592.1 hypothetical protein K452DRAFT_296601 [Aplosporella prunicola CBS 121167]